MLFKLIWKFFTLFRRGKLCFKRGKICNRFSIKKSSSISFHSSVNDRFFAAHLFTPGKKPVQSCIDVHRSIVGLTVATFFHV